MPKARSKRHDGLVAQVLVALPKLDDLAKVPSIAERAKLSHTETLHRLTDMRHQGLVELRRHQGYYITEKGQQQLALLRRKAGEKPPSDDSLVQRLWNGMRVLRKWSDADLQQLAFSTSDHDPTTRAAAYARLLLAAEVIQPMPGIAGRFRLALNFGPTAPTWRDSYGALFDWNAGKAIPAPEVQP